MKADRERNEEFARAFGGATAFVCDAPSVLGVEPAVFLLAMQVAVNAALGVMEPEAQAAILASAQRMTAALRKHLNKQSRDS